VAFIKTTPAIDADGPVLDMYERQEDAWGYVPDYAKVFCHRPEVMARWGRLLAEVRRPTDARFFELVTFAVAHELRHSSCSLAHGNALAKMIGTNGMIALANGAQVDSLSDAELAAMAFARKIARDASKITYGDVAALRELHGYSDEQIFDIAAIAAARCFFTKILDALGSEPDVGFMTMDEDLRRALTVGRPISHKAPEYVARTAPSIRQAP
jgi:alkylhydroperoxidase family enzyme